jgi:hypothetical protein
MEPLDPGPAIKVRRGKLGTGGNRIPGMDVQIRNDIHRLSIDRDLKPGKGYKRTDPAGNYHKFRVLCYNYTKL